MNYIEYCSHCEITVTICGKCGNNTCNGGYGKVDGKDCDQCPSAYTEDNAIAGLNEILLALVGSKELVEKWWHSYNKAFGMQPLEMYNIDRRVVIKYLLDQVQR